MAAMPIYGKNHSDDFFSRTAGSVWLIFLHEAYGAPSYIKQLKSVRLDYKQALNGLGKVRKNDAKFQIHGPFELGSQFFIGLLKTMF